MKGSLIFVSLLVLIVSGCKTVDRNDFKAAVVTNFDQAAKKEIANVINKVMPGANVALADDILSKSNLLPIQKAEYRVDGNPVDGRIIEMPRQFELYQVGDSCYLVDAKTQQQYLLKRVKCKVL